MYYLEDSFFSTEPKLFHFFQNNKPMEGEALELDPTYFHYLLNDEGDEVGIEALSPLIISIILRTESHFQVLLSLLIQDAERTFTEDNKLNSTLDSHFYHLKQCAIEINYAPIINILLAIESPVFNRTAFQTQLTNTHCLNSSIFAGKKVELSFSELTNQGLFSKNSSEDHLDKSDKSLDFPRR